MEAKIIIKDSSFSKGIDLLLVLLVGLGIGCLIMYQYVISHPSEVLQIYQQKTLTKLPIEQPVTSQKAIDWQKF